MRIRIRVRGVVQGVGFRPFVYLIAHEARLAGWVLNDADGVLLEVEGEPTAIARFEALLASGAPPHATVESTDTSEVPVMHEAMFEIRPSPAGASGVAGVLPDLATCPDCLAEVFDVDDRRHRYPFTNCTHCGPRFSIVERLPYDRSNTTMAQFEMCGLCQSEYEDPSNRRFHAQPNACPNCGPQLRLHGFEGDAALSEAQRRLCNGEVVAVKGLGGFHLMVNALDGDAVRRLRVRKSRGNKPFAVMFPGVHALNSYCEPSPVELDAVGSAAAPIVLMRRGRGLSPAIAPGNPYVGAMLPYTPLHHILLRDLGFPLVATSANRAGEPICIDGDDARDRLGEIADAFLDHNRAIRRPVEDSVLRQYADTIVVLRRGRGLAPGRVAKCERDELLGRGAQLKSALAVSRGGSIILGPHIGDLSDDLRTIATYEAAVCDLPSLFGITVSSEVHDMHPDYVSRSRQTHAVATQHHHAHAAACLAEHNLDRVLAVAWDGTGYGGDGTLWGGEFLDATLHSFERVAHLRQFRLPGGEAAIREPRRQGFALLLEVDRRPPAEPEHEPLRAMIEHRLNAPLTSSAGRLFDAVSWILGFAPSHITFDGEAAIALEYAAGDLVGTELPTPELRDDALDWGPLVLALLDSDQPREQLAAGFHDALARAIANVAATTEPEHVALVGGCFQNRRLLESAAAEIRAVKRIPVWCQQIPPNDGGIAAGQVAIAAAKQP